MWIRERLSEDSRRAENALNWIYIETARNLLVIVVGTVRVPEVENP